MYPHERSLVKRLENEPFALLGVNSDTNMESLKEVLKKEKITWRSWRDSRRRIAGAWNVESWPTIYVLDCRGVIRFRDVRGKALDGAVNLLLTEMEREEL
jgi:hypothetical protein